MKGDKLNKHTRTYAIIGEKENNQCQMYNIQD